MFLTNSYLNFIICRLLIVKPNNNIFLFRLLFAIPNKNIICPPKSKGLNTNELTLKD